MYNSNHNLDFSCYFKNHIKDFLYDQVLDIEVRYECKHFN